MKRTLVLTAILVVALALFGCAPTEEVATTKTAIR